MATTMKTRLEAIGRHLDEVGTRAKAVPADAKPRIKRHLDALRKDFEATEAAAAAARAKRQEAASEQMRAIQSSIQQLEDRTNITVHSVEADLADDQMHFADKVEQELYAVDTYIDHLGSKAATQKTAAELKQHRDVLAKTLHDSRAASGKRWAEQKKRVLAAREELERKADELTAKLHH